MTEAVEVFLDIASASRHREDVTPGGFEGHAAGKTVLILEELGERVELAQRDEPFGPIRSDLFLAGTVGHGSTRHGAPS